VGDAPGNGQSNDREPARGIHPPAAAIQGDQTSRRPNSRKPVSLWRWSRQAHTRHQWSPFGDNQRRPVHEGVSAQCVACNCFETPSPSTASARRWSPGDGRRAGASGSRTPRVRRPATRSGPST